MHYWFNLITFYCAFPFLVGEKIVLKIYLLFTAISFEEEPIMLEIKNKDNSWCFFSLACQIKYIITIYLIFS